MSAIRLICTSLIVSLLCLNVFAQSMPTASPKSLGFSKDRLDRITASMNQHVADGDFSGATGLIARHGKIVYFETYGDQNRESSTPMAEDTIFRIYSMSKAITGVAVMILHEEGHFFLTDAVSKYLPEYDEMTVASANNEPAKAENQITIRDLLRHTAGITYGGGGNSAKYYRSSGVRGNHDLAEFSKRLATVPLEFEPGTEWEYGYSIDVLGRLVEVVSGQTFDVFLEDRIFKPLGMTDTAFHVPSSKHDRLATLYSPNPEGPGVYVATSRAQDSYKEPAVFFSGGGGLVSTTMDYARFCQMLLNDGDLDGAQVLGKKAVELMRTDHLGDIPKNGYLIARDGIGFGLTFAVTLDPGQTGAIDSKGVYRWGGAAGTRFWIDPVEDMFCVFMVNILPYGTLNYGDEFRLLAYQAIVD